MVAQPLLYHLEPHSRRVYLSSFITFLDPERSVVILRTVAQRTDESSAESKEASQNINRYCRREASVDQEFERCPVCLDRLRSERGLQRVLIFCKRDKEWRRVRSARNRRQVPSGLPDQLLRCALPPDGLDPRPVVANVPQDLKRDQAPVFELGAVVRPATPQEKARIAAAPSRASG